MDQKPSFIQTKAAFFFALSHLIFSLIVQGENHFATQSSGEGFDAALWFFLTLPFAQLETVVVCIALVFLCYTFARNKVGALFVWLVGFAVNLYLILDQLSYPLLGDHLRPSYYEGYEGGLGWLSIILSSVRAIMGLSFYLNLILLVIWSVWSVALLRQKTQPHLLLKIPRRWIIVAVTYFFMTVIIGVFAEPSGLNENPAFILVQSLWQQNQNQKPHGNFIAHYAQSLWGKFTVNDGEKQKLIKFRETIVKEHDHPNIIFVVLESIGAKQILTGPNQSFDAAVMPNLAQQANHMVVFDSVYTVFPATIRAHIAMNTVSVMTWGSVYEELMHPYLGFSLKEALHNLGYRTAVFSAQNLDVENMGRFFQGLNYDRYFEPELDDEEAQKKYQLNSWGMREDYVWSKALEWMKEENAQGKSTFMNFLTVCTHHPYSVPTDFIVSPLSKTENEDKDRYLRALAYTDHVVGQMFSDLKTSGLADNTLVVLVGDHGEAFAEWHRGDRLHKNHLYDENVRGFVAVWDGKRPHENFISHRIASITDVPATILSLVKNAPPAPRGQSLFSEDFVPKIVFFHKNNTPEQWGLRDGRWKFISSKTDSQQAELYDLQNDPNEQNNLISNHPNAHKIYNPRIASWYVDMNSLFVSGLENYHYLGGQGLQVADVMSAGPKTMSIGYRDAHGEFVEASMIHPQDQVEAKIKLVSYDKNTMLIFEWITPSGQIIKKHHPIDSDWTTYTAHDDLGDELEIGTWRLLVKERDQKILERDFKVKK